MKSEEEIHEYDIPSGNSKESFYLKNLNSEVVDERKSKTKLIKKNKNAKMKFKNSSGFMSLYITSCENDVSPKVTLHQLRTSMPSLDIASSVETNYGLIVNLANDIGVKKMFSIDLTKVFGKPVQVAPLFSGHLKKNVIFKDIPWCIRNEELEICLKRQGIQFAKITRDRSTVFVEVTNISNYHRLQEEGINFYNSVIFKATEDLLINDDIIYNSDNIIQCYRCQGFWHTASTCKQNIRCVRCGEEHSVENCNRPKYSPICCNCKGPHHAAYKLCPVRLKLRKSVRVSFSFCQ